MTTINLFLEKRRIILPDQLHRPASAPAITVVQRYSNDHAKSTCSAVVLNERLAPRRHGGNDIQELDTRVVDL